MWSFYELSEAAWWALCVDEERLQERLRYEYPDQIDTNPRRWEPDEF
jgi:hypothetical protein